MELKEKIAKLILDKFRERNGLPNHFIMARIYNHTVIPVLNPQERNLFKDVANALIDEGYIHYETGKSGQEGFRLTEKGYERIYA
ncbi:MAG: hypothetical protein LBH22_07395 [Bacteroidales bacterium]|jgi:hypothetical protein|nr:hypothetical protein [Bacteroidales bacterium]